jgi:hypothetical protein
MNKRAITALLLACLAAPLAAEDAKEGKDAKADSLAAEYNVPKARVLALREKMGWGEVKHALAISNKAGVPVDDVVALRDSGMGWGQIAQKYGFKLGDVTGKGKSMDKPGKRGEHRGPPPSAGPKGGGPKGGNPHGGGHPGGGRKK